MNNLKNSPAMHSGQIGLQMRHPSSLFSGQCLKNKQEETTQSCIGIGPFIEVSLTSGMGATREQND
jgi:hypothetical protein